MLMNEKFAFDFSKLKAWYKPYTLKFKKAARTSRGALIDRKIWLIHVARYDASAAEYGTGECAPLPGLSIDPMPTYEEMLQQVCMAIDRYSYWLTEGLQSYPSIRFGLEMALIDLAQGGKQIWFPSLFTEGKAFVQINGLIWMGTKEEMQKQIDAKLKEGYSCLKLKIGALSFDDEIALLRHIRTRYSTKTLQLRVDANGAFSPHDVLEKLKQLSMLEVHSIEQPIAPGQLEEMSRLCQISPIAIALDEELIGITDVSQKKALLEHVQPHYLVLKPSLLGGFSSALEWISLATEQKTDWWITSALESNIGLSSLAQWTFTLHHPMPQGLGTGQLYENNFTSPLFLQGDKLFFLPAHRE